MKVRLTDKAIYIIAILNSIILILTWGVHIAIDTPTYVYAWDNSFSNGIIDILRTPIYPLILGLTKAIFGENFYWATIVLQHCVLIISVIYFKRMLEWKIKSPTAVRWITLAYAIMPATSSWANCILTELFAFTGVVFLFYNLLKFYKKTSWSCVIWSTFWLAFLIFLRPAFLYLIPSCIIAWIFFYKYKKQMSLCGILGVICITLLEGFYCKKFEEQYGVFAPSSVSTINLSYLAFHDGLMKPEYTNDVGLKQYIESYDSTNPDNFGPSVSEYGLVTIATAIKSSQKDQPFEWIKKGLGRFYRASQMSYLAAYAGYVTITDMIGINLNSLYLFILVFSFFLIKKSVKNRKIYKVSSLLLLTGIGNLVTAVIGAQSEWGRLLIPSLPLFLILFGQIFNYIKYISNEE